MFEIIFRVAQNRRESLHFLKEDWKFMSTLGTPKFLLTRDFSLAKYSLAQH